MAQALAWITGNPLRCRCVAVMLPSDADAAAINAKITPARRSGEIENCDSSGQNTSATPAMPRVEPASAERLTGTEKNRRRPTMLQNVTSEKITATSPEVRDCSDR